MCCKNSETQIMSDGLSPPKFHVNVKRQTLNKKNKKNKSPRRQSVTASPSCHPITTL
jgi:hypothetical protein